MIFSFCWFLYVLTTLTQWSQRSQRGRKKLDEKHRNRYEESEDSERDPDLVIKRRKQHKSKKDSKTKPSVTKKVWDTDPYFLTEEYKVGLRRFHRNRTTFFSYRDNILHDCRPTLLLHMFPSIPICQQYFLPVQWM